MHDDAPRNEDKSATTVRAVERAFEILGCFGTEQKTLSLTEAARAVGLPLSTVSRLLTTLEATQFVRRLGDGRYRPGPRLLRIGVLALHGVELFDSAEPYLARLAEESGESANLAVPTGDGHALYIRHVPSRHSVRHANWIGRTVPIPGTAIGQALSGDIPAAGYTVCSATLEPDVTALAVPIHGPDGTIVAAVSVTAPSYRVSEEFIQRTGLLLVAQAEKMSADIGGQRP